MMDLQKMNLPISGGLTSGEDQLLYDYAQGTLAVDLGTFLGRAAVILSLKTKKIIAIDAFFNSGSLFTKYPNYRFDSVKNSFEKYGNIELVKGMVEDAELTKILGMKKIDVLFVDVEPRFDILSQIGDAWFPYIKKNKFIILNNFQKFDGVTAFVEELTLSSDYEEVDCVDSCVVIKKLKA